MKKLYFDFSKSWENLPKQHLKYTLIVFPEK